MAYENGYSNGRGGSGMQQRPPPQRQYAPPQQQYDQYDDGYAYGQDQYAGGGDNGYDQGYAGPYDEQGYGQQRQQPPPQRGGYGPPNGGGRPPPPPLGRGGGGGGMERKPYVLLRGGRQPADERPDSRAANSVPGMNRSPPQPQSPPGLADTFGGSPFPMFQGQSRKTDLDLEQSILGKMSNMDIGGGKRAPPPNGRPMGNGGGGGGGGGGGSGRGGGYGMQDDYGRPPTRGQQPPPQPRGPPGPPRNYGGPQGFPEQRRGPPPPQQGRGGYDDYQDPGFSAPQRTMTMPSNMETDFGNLRPPPPRSENGGFASPSGRGTPQRPSTAQGMRQAPAMYPSGPARPPPQQMGYDQGYGYEQQDQVYPQQSQRPVSYDNIYDDYYGNDQNDAGYGQAHPGPPSHFEPASQQTNDYARSMPPPPPPPPNGAARVAQIGYAQTSPEFRQPQAAVYDAVQETPPMPAYQDNYAPRPNSAKGAVNGGSIRSPPPPGSSGGLPAHPAPVRPGLMPNSLVNTMDNKPPPVRNYGSGSSIATTNTNTMAAPQQQQALGGGGGGGGGPSPSQQQAKEPPVTTDELERLRSMVKVDPQNQPTALRLAKKLLEASDVLIPDVPDPKPRARARERYLTDCQKILKKLASAQNADAMFLLADCVGKGTFGNAPDDKEAFTLYQSAAKVGHPAAAYRTAVCCEIGHEEGGGTRKDPLKAIQWYKRAATLGDTPAMYKVGMILLKGLLGQQRNPAEAITWLNRASKAADSENPHAFHELGLLYENPPPNVTTIFRDEPYAFSLFRQGADLGYKFSQYRLGSCYEYGLLGCPIDPRLSIMWYSKAAAQEEHQAELALSGWYLTGSPGVLGQSDTEAYLWARKSAAAGLAKAEYAMGYFTETGIGVPANLEDAKRWYWRAAAQNFPKARERLEDIKRTGKNGPRARERISRSRIGSQNEGECAMM